MEKEGIKIEGYSGTWHVIDETFWHGRKVYLLEHDTYGDMTASLIINKDKQVILGGVWNGFADLDDLE